MTDTREAKEKALARVYVVGDETCALCGAKGEILYHFHGGWWCRVHEHIPAEKFQSEEVPLVEGIRRFIDYHS